MKVLLSLFIRAAVEAAESAAAQAVAEFRIYLPGERSPRAVIEVPGNSERKRSPLALALLAFPELIDQLGQAGVREVGWAGSVPPGRLRPASAWLMFGEVREEDLLAARRSAIETADRYGISFAPDPAEGRVGKLGEINLAQLLSKGRSGGSRPVEKGGDELD